MENCVMKPEDIPFDFNNKQIKLYIKTFKFDENKHENGKFKTSEDLFHYSLKNYNLKKVITKSRGNSYH
jgi:hypothetical protein